MRTPQAVVACLLSTAICFGQSGLAQAQQKEDASRCSDAVVEQVGRHFGLAEFAYPADGTAPSAENGGMVVAGICRPWPTNKSRTIAAFAYDAGTEDEKRLLLVVVEGPGNRVVASYTRSIPEDAITEVSDYSLKLDTARYTLSNTARAFGLRMSTFRDRCGYEGGFDDELTLFVVDGQTIRPVLTEMMSHWSYGRGNRCSGDDVARTDARVSISVEPTASNGFADLRLTGTRTDKRKPVSVVVKYNGDHYELKPWTAAFSAWWD
ncbi:hypothetical protein [Niveibacterium sp.]|uniref:hypothetical protein n=1 Tax=Niveibacterium sp. TaxID=2017444 RepID=UPI0035B49DB3